MNPSADIDFKAIRLVLELARHQSFTTTAENVHMSQSALSRSISDTEHKLGTQLFTRTTRSVSLTPSGREFVRIAKDILDTRTHRLAEFELFREGLGGKVDISTLPSIAATVLPRLVFELHQSAPNISIHIRDSLADNAIRNLVFGNSDFTLASRTETPKGLTFNPIAKDRFYVVHGMDHVLAKQSAATWNEVAKYPLVSFSQASSIRSYVDRAFSSISCEPCPIIEAENVGTVAGLVATGLGVSVVPEFVLPLMSFANLVSTPLEEPVVHRSLGIVTVPNRPMSPAAQQTIEVLIRIASQPVQRPI